MSKHTPGPWKWEFQPDEHGYDTHEIFIQSDKKLEIARIDPDMAEVSQDEWVGNAILIAQAWRIPALLRVYEAALELREHEKTESPSSHDHQNFNRHWQHRRELKTALDTALAAAKVE